MVRGCGGSWSDGIMWDLPAVVFEFGRLITQKRKRADPVANQVDPAAD